MAPAVLPADPANLADLRASEPPDARGDVLAGFRPGAGAGPVIGRRLLPE